MRVEPEQLSAFLLDAGLVKQEQLVEAQHEAAQSGKKLGAVLLEKKIVSQEELVKLEAYILGIPFVNLEKDTIPPDVLHIIPEPIARKYSVVAFRRKGSELEVAMTDPEDIQTIEFIRKKANLTILPRLTNAASIAATLKQYQESIEQEFSSLFGVEGGGEGGAPKEGEESGSLEGKIITGSREDDGEGGTKAEDLAKAAEAST